MVSNAIEARLMTDPLLKMNGTVNLNTALCSALSKPTDGQTYVRTPHTMSITAKRISGLACTPPLTGSCSAMPCSVKPFAIEMHFLGLPI